MDETLNTLKDNSKYNAKNIPIEKFIELRKKGLSHNQIAKVLGCSNAASYYRLSAIKDELECAEAFKTNKADYLNHKQWMLLNRLNDETIKDMSGLQLVTGAAILYDKQRLEDGKSTSNIDIHAELQSASSLLISLKQQLNNTTVDNCPDNDKVIIDDNVDKSID